MILYNLNDSERFKFHSELVIDALKLQDQARMASFKDLLTTLLGSEYTMDILTAAVFQLAEIDLDTCRWALHNFYDLELCLGITEGLTLFAAQKLIEKGFILGQDFSATPTGGIVLKKKAKVALMEEISALDCLFLEKVSQVVD